MIEVFVDGAARGQGTLQAVYSPEGEETKTLSRVGEAAVGVAIYRNRKMIGQFARGLGKRTNNEAEYEALLMGVLLCWAADLPDPIIYSDSRVVVKQVNGEWECKPGALTPLLLSVQEIREVFRFRVVQVPRKTVWEADALAKAFLDKLEGKDNGIV